MVSSVMNFETFYPNHAVLQKHIEYFYFFKSGSSGFTRTYYSFPNISTPVNIHSNIDIFIKDSLIKVSESNHSNYTITINQVRESPLLVEWRGKLDKVTIVFKPLGLNNFLDKPFVDVVQGFSQIFLAWNNAPGFNFFLNHFYSCIENSKRVSVLEDFLLSIYTPLKDQAVLDEAVHLLSDFDNELPINKVADRLGLAYRTFDRLFKKHLGMSPIVYKKIARFRHSLKNKVFNDRFKKLTEIGYESNFYDQSYFIKVYTKLTGANPTTFFNSIETLADSHLIFQLLDK
jgi:AraC-like DNA-binding protein